MRCNKLLRKMLWNKILISLVPIFCFLFFIVVYFSSTNQTNFKKIQQNTLQKGVEELVGQYENLLVMCNDLSDNFTVKHFLSEDYEDSIHYGMLEVMQMISLPRTFYESFWFLPENHNYLYSAAGITSHIHDFNVDGGKYYNFSDYTHEELCSLFHNVSQTTVLKSQEIRISESVEEYVVILMPIRQGIVKKGTLFTMVSTERLGNFLGGAQGTNYGNIFVSPQGEILYSDFEEDLSLDAIQNDSVQGYMLLTEKTYFFDMDVYRLIDLSYISQGSAFVYVMAITLTAFCVVYVALYIRFSIKTEYAPIRDISESCAKYMYGAGDSGLNGELDELRILSKTLEVFREAKTTERVCLGKDFGNEGLKAALLSENSNYGKGNEGEKRCLMLVFAENEFCEKTGENVEEYIEKYFSSLDDARVNVEYTKVDNYYAIAVCYESNSSFNSFLNSFEKDIFERFGKEKIKIAIAECLYGEQWSFAYLEAKRTLHYMLAKCLEDNILVAEEMYEEEENRGVLIDILNQLDVATRMHDARKMNKLLDSIVSFVLNPDTSWEECQILYNYMKTSVLRIFRGCLDERDFIKLSRMLNANISNVSIMAVLIDSLKKYLTEYLVSVEGVQENKYDIEEICSYIQTHFQEENFSLNVVAMHFDIGVSFLSKIFKERKGINFKEYVDILVFEKAKELLVSTDKTIEDISQELHYSNASNFLRAFKRQFGISAGQYRKKHKVE